MSSKVITKTNFPIQYSFINLTIANKLIFNLGYNVSTYNAIL